MTKDKFMLDKNLEILMIALSDRASRGEYEDLSGPEIKKMVDNYFSQKNWKFQSFVKLIPDDALQFEDLLDKACKNKTDIVISTGGTGVGPRDFTPEIAKKIIEKELPGIMENIRVKYGQLHPNALLSRSIAGVTGETQLYCLPGSVKAVKEYMVEILKTMEHLIFMIHSVDVHEKH